MRDEPQADHGAPGVRGGDGGVLRDVLAPSTTTVGAYLSAPAHRYSASQALLGVS
ncbi:hypothetical protein [Streptomyces sp. NBC_01012]|uniref:hypothetical protein n=1 Tax=Streptomyces sp. NBC_01012 TaxID=2903717 RepID=UPI00386739B0|nr:hypothetical protein OG623_03860 [Streptomyces sp. NBC_01012]